MLKYITAPDLRSLLDLQRFATPIQGGKVIFAVRVLDTAATMDAAVIAFQTEGSVSISKDADSTATKQGSIRTSGAAETEIDLSAILEKGDTRIDEFKKAMTEDKLFEIWEIDSSQEGEGDNKGKFKATYYQGYMTDFEKTYNAEDLAELSMNFGINGVGVEGYATLTTDQINAAQYVFKDTVKEESAADKTASE